MIGFIGKGVCGGAAVGQITVIKKNKTAVTKYEITDTEAEKERFRTARETAEQQLSLLFEKAKTEIGEADAAIFELHIMMLEDDDYIEAVEAVIDEQSVNAEYAVSTASESFARIFSDMDDEYMRSRSADVIDISDRVINILMGICEHTADTDEKAIICADDLAPSETLLLDKSKVLAFATAFGSSNSHTAILAGSMNIPAVVGLGEAFIDSVKDGMTMTVDGYTGECMLGPDEEYINKINGIIAEDEKKRKLLMSLKGKESITSDGRRIGIYANIGGVGDIPDVIENDADGIGLFRSEFLYLGRNELPDEEEQFTAYKTVLSEMNGKRVIIRTLDIGADKQADYLGLEKEENPALGCRAIRLCLDRPEIFRTQLRALFRASIYGRLGIMFPMITSTSELRRILDICDDVKSSLSDEGIPFSESTEIGIMIETPAAAIISDRLAPMVDFFSVGTNDLTQYTLACDRQNRAVEEFADTHHEAIFRLIEMSIKNAHENGIWIGICGELAADMTLTERFLKMGIDELSVSPHFVLGLREKVINAKTE